MHCEAPIQDFLDFEEIQLPSSSRGVNSIIKTPLVVAPTPLQLPGHAPSTKDDNDEYFADKMRGLNLKNEEEEEEEEGNDEDDEDDEDEEEQVEDDQDSGDDDYAALDGRDASENNTELIQKTVNLLSAHKLSIAEMVEVSCFEFFYHLYLFY